MDFKSQLKLILPQRTDPFFTGAQMPDAENHSIPCYSLKEIISIIYQTNNYDNKKSKQ
jgi:hypothetical protein